jgi:hypothetical protein
LAIERSRRPGQIELMPISAPVRVLSRSQVRLLLRWPELIEVTEQALAVTAADRSAATPGQLPVPGASVHLKSGGLRVQRPRDHDAMTAVFTWANPRSPSAPFSRP